MTYRINTPKRKPTMKITDRVKDGIGVISLEGQIIASTVDMIKNYLEAFIEDTEIKALVMDCQEVDLVDSTGLGLFVSVFKTLQRLGKKLIFSGINTKTKETLTLTNLMNIFTTTENVNTAIEVLQNKA